MDVKRFQIHQITSRLKHFKLRLRLAIDLLLECSTFVVRCAKAIKLKSFLLLQICRLTNNSSFFTPINTTQTLFFSCWAIFPSFSNSNWKEFQCFGDPDTHTHTHTLTHWLWELEPTSLNGVRSLPWPATSECGCTGSKRHLKVVALRCRRGGVQTVGGSLRLPPSIWAGGTAHNTNAYLNDYFAFICMKIK